MVRLKEDETYISLSADGSAAGDRDGLFRRDTRYLRTYAWSFGAVTPLLTATDRGTLHQHFARVGADRGQAVSFIRQLTMRSNGFDDCWTVRNTSAEPQDIALSLDVVGDFRDLFASLIQNDSIVRPEVKETRVPTRLTMDSTASDGIRLSASLAFSEAAAERAWWAWRLAPGEQRSLTVAVTLTADDDGAISAILPSYDEWRSGFTAKLSNPIHARALTQAIDDLRMLLLTTPHGLYPAAGMPWFVNVFGRDALITGMMLLDAQPGVLRDVLRLLAAEQGREVNPFREEEPGKILHEMRSGELSRTGRIPFGRYYGSVDSTALFVMGIAAAAKHESDRGLIDELRPAWEAAIGWLAEHQGDDGGLVSFAPSGSGLTIQSWKDSADSMNHADGRPAESPLSVAEVQGYTFAAFRSVASFYRDLGDDEQAREYEARATRLAEEFHSRFWIDELSTYAMAIDGKGDPLAVLSSDPGHLLWSGIVPVEIAPRLVATLMGEALWSGWGLRTLGMTEVRFNPVSYHNGSVWPHDTALFAWGLSRYGFDAEMRVVAQALFDLADAQPDHRLPELIAGCARVASLPPTAYTHACYPQSWAAASLPLLARLLADADARA